MVLGGTSVLPIELGTDSDQIIANGDVTLGGALEVSFTEARALGVSAFSIVDESGDVSQAFDEVVGISGLLIQADVGVDQATSDVIVTSTVVLPSTFGGLSND